MGRMKNRVMITVFAALVIVAAACSDDGDDKEAATTTTSSTTTTAAPTTTSAAPSTSAPASTAVTLAPGRPDCDGAAGVERDVRAGYAGAVPDPATDIIVSNVRLASSDPSYASANSGPARPDVQIQGGYSILHCPEVGGSGGNLWVTVVEGTSMVGCDSDLPPAVKAELAQGPC
jgi:hypothetical protein